MTGSMNKAGSSFMSRSEQASLLENAEKAGQAFRKSVKEQRDEGLSRRDLPRQKSSADNPTLPTFGISEGDLMKLATRASNGDQGAQDEMMRIANGEAEGIAQLAMGDMDLLSDEDLKVDTEAKSRQEESEEEDEITPTRTLDDGTIICNHCNYVVERPQELEISDEELVGYFLGGRVQKTFKVGMLVFVIQSLTDTEIRIADERVAAAHRDGAFSTERDVQQFRALCLLCFSVVSLMGNDMSSILNSDKKKSDVNSSLSDIHDRFEKRLQGHMSRGHHIQVKMSQRSEELETAILMAIDDGDRIKN